MKSIQADHKEALSLAVEVISNGGLIVYPTDTVYGLGADATNDSAIQKLNKLKNRSGPMSVIAPDRNAVKNWVESSFLAWDLVKDKLGGKTTVIMPVKENVVSPLILGEDETLGIRIPDHPFPIKLVNLLGFPITTTSVNRSGEPLYTDPKIIAANFSDNIDLIIDDGILSSEASAIYILENNSLKTIR
ncbi:MAG: L-threonylcarbamoyladenylate synthase [Candidatus Marinimicrobia bacterium]|jgi:tRNA threonylcarbamoyl adenosine modification protein (Sua5/YciO/YrdC/YwlC family)|nr:L-threonylcarbamoyladenylate synthase [Candidatus Neomarinimicrobiota bacterium]MDP6789103.1 L-threonylcarbamoyladenylate synthase [Candidatus Neomarinimicrobiota bacterium]MDP7072005.1 L-threonylcarbamoyladenylate synthase [Candidatus Neomarinimicrobiota bacterium]